MELVAYFHSFTKTPCSTNAPNMIITSIGVRQHQIMILTMNGATVFVSIHLPLVPLVYSLENFSYL